MKLLKTVQQDIIDIFNKQQIHPYVAYVMLDCIKRNIMENMILDVQPKGLPTLKDSKVKGYQ